MQDLFEQAGPESLQVPGAELLLYRQVDLGVEPDLLLRDLIEDTAWRSDHIHVFGKTYRQPRLVAWYGDPGTAYSYSGIRLEPLPWTDTLHSIRQRVETWVGHRFNSVLLNYYRDQRDSVGLHADDEPELGPRPVIASLSLGEERRFVMRHKHDAGARPVSFTLPGGSLLVMSGPTQENWKHGVPKQSHRCGGRVNLTFRFIHTEGRAGVAQG